MPLPDHWQDRFEIITLTEIMRQKEDVAFAELLNRIRVKGKKEALSEADRSLLAQAVTDRENCPIDVMHIFPTNDEVNQHNATTVSTLHPDIIMLDAHDHKKDPRTGRMERLRAPLKGGKYDLVDSLHVAEGARVMITKNIDVDDGLVNGSFGTVVRIVTGKQGETEVVRMLGLQLDNPNAGQKSCRKIPGGPNNAVYIERIEESLSNHKGVIRRQFPMKLAYASTIHRVQGMTVDELVVYMQNIKSAGMAYVALSRTTSLRGLHIVGFDEKKIFADPRISSALENVKRATVDNAMPLLKHAQKESTTPTLTVIHHNTEGLASHIDDIKAHHELRLADVLCLTETFLQGSFVAESLQLDGYRMFKRNRHASYTNYADMASKDKGGVAIYVRNSLQAREIPFIHGVTDLEYLVVKVEAPVKALIATVYRPRDYSEERCIPNLRNLMDSLRNMDHEPIIICGDFNENIVPNPGDTRRVRKPIFDLFGEKQYRQMIRSVTTENDTCLDLIYMTQPQCCLNDGVLQTYYSYHNPVYCVIRSYTS